MQGRGRSNLCQIPIALCYNKTIFKSNQIKRYISCYAIVYTICIYFKSLSMYKIEKYVFKLRSKRFFFECLWFLEFIIHDAKLRSRRWINFYYNALIYNVIFACKWFTFCSNEICFSRNYFLAQKYSEIISLGYCNCASHLLFLRISNFCMSNDRYRIWF